MTLVGYGRVSTTDQHPQSQLDALTAAGCEKVFVDAGVGGKLASRPQLDACRDYIREGDTLVITRLDRLGRSIKNLIEISDWLRATGIELKVIEQGIDTTTSEGRLFFHILAAVAEFEHDLIVQRTKEGLAAARARGRLGGRGKKMTAKQIVRAREMYDARTLTVAEIAKQFGVGRATIYRVLEPKQAEAPARIAHPPHAVTAVSIALEARKP